MIIVVIVITVMITRLLFALQLIARKLSTPNIKQKSIVQETRSRSNKVLFTIQANRVGPDENNVSEEVASGLLVTSAKSSSSGHDLNLADLRLDNAEDGWAAFIANQDI